MLVLHSSPKVKSSASVTIQCSAPFLLDTHCCVMQPTTRFYTASGERCTRLLRAPLLVNFPTRLRASQKWLRCISPKPAFLDSLSTGGKKRGGTHCSVPPT